MPSINEVTREDIERLTSINLPHLLKILLELEATFQQIAHPRISVPMNTTTSDGGEDGSIEWEAPPERTIWLPHFYCFFQVKATHLIPSKCAAELFQKASPGKPRTLKVRVDKVVEAGGIYILFTSQSLTETGISARITGFRKGLRMAKKANAETMRIEVYDANKIATWVNLSIAAVSFVKQCIGTPRPNAFQTWDQWLKNGNRNSEGYKVDKLLDTHMEQIRSSILILGKIRVWGHSGLGKTRLVLESFRTSALKSSIVYYDHQGITDIKEIKDYFLNNQDQQRGIIVIDNCSAKNHLILSELMGVNSQLKLITIGLDDSTAIEDPKIKLDRKDQTLITRTIILAKLQHSHPQADIQYLEELCGGYPWMAIKFCENIRKNNRKDFSGFLPEEFISKLLFNGDTEPLDYAIIRACAVFSSFAFPDPDITSLITPQESNRVKAQSEYIRLHILDPNVVSYDRFYEVCQRYKGQDIIERVGMYYTVKPSVLAINLAADWLRHTDPDKIKQILITLKTEELGSKITERLKDLDQYPQAATIVQELWGSDGFFASAEVLNTSWGSLLFRNVATVSPIVTARSLQKTFGQLSKSRLMLIVEGRRNLVWALEKLVFPQESFSTAARVLFQFAVAENESWSNNATNQFLQLFQAYLAGTEADYSERILILKWGLEKQDDDYTRLVVLAIGRALKFDNLTRMVGPEKHGSKLPMQDYRPSRQETVNAYWISLLELLKPLAAREDALGDLAKTNVARSIRTMIRYQLTDQIILFVRSIVAKDTFFWKQAYDELNKAIEYEKPLPDIIAKIEQLLGELEPQDLKNQLLFNVINPTWHRFRKGTDTNYTDTARIRAESFADRVLEQHLDIKPYFVDLLTGQQLQTFNFAKRIGALSINKDALIHQAIEILKTIAPPDLNPGLVAGLLAGAADDALFSKYLDELVNDPVLNRLTFFITRSYSFNFQDLERLLRVTATHPALITQFNVFTFGQVLDRLPNEQLISLTDQIQAYGKAGKYTALSLLFMQTLGEPTKWDSLREPIKKLLERENLLQQPPEDAQVDMYHWQESVLHILEDTPNALFAQTISRQIVDFCTEEEHDYSLDIELVVVIEALFDQYFEDVWPIFGNALTTGSYLTYLRLREMLWSKEMSNAKSQWIFSRPTRSEAVLDWVRTQAAIGQSRIAGILPIEDNNEGNLQWHPVTQIFLDEFSNNPEVLKAIAANMGTFSSSGPMAPYYQSQLELMERLSGHPILAVRDWAERNKQSLHKMIKRSELEEQGRQS